jgi:plastocyanin
MQTRARFIAVVGCVVSFILVSGFSCSKTENGQATIYMENGRYNPGNLTVAQGTLVTFINNDTVAHTATAPSAFDSGPVAPSGGRWTWVASMAGTFHYHSLMQPSMAGTITVTPATPTGY